MKQLLTAFSSVLACLVLLLGTMVPVWAAAGGPLCPVSVAASKAAGGAVLDSLSAVVQPLVLKGTVLLRTGQPCAGASVYVAGAPRQLVVTNAQGLFTLPASAGGVVVVCIDYFGEGTSRVKVSLPVSKPLCITLGQ